MITVQQAKKLRHHQTVYIIGEYNADGTAMRVRVTGKVQLWKTRPSDFKVPVKRGLYENGYIEPWNAKSFSLREPARHSLKKFTILRGRAIPNNARK